MSGLNLRIGFAGSPPFAAAILERLVAQRPVTVIYCQPARPAGRGKRLAPCAVERFAREQQIPVESPPSLRGDGPRRTLAEHQLDLLIVAAYGLILPASILPVPSHGCINVHASLLPRWRGAAPIERAIMAGDATTGISIMQMDAGVDTGPILRSADCPIDITDTGDTLHKKLAALGAATLLDCLTDWPTLVKQPQAECGITYASKLTSADAQLEWGQSAEQLALTVRALNSRRPAFTWFGSDRVSLLMAQPSKMAANMAAERSPGQILRFDPTALTVACGLGAIDILRLQLAGRSALDAREIHSGYRNRFRPGLHFANAPSA